MPSATVESLLKSLPPARSKAIAEVRAAIKKRVPKGYEEAVVKGMIVWQVPLERYRDTYNKQPLWLAALGTPKSYLTLHLLPVYFNPPLLKKLEAGFEKAGKKLDIGKACIRFESADDLALDAIGDVVASVELDGYVAIAQAAQKARKKK